jgi:hypothetical protein
MPGGQSPPRVQPAPAQRPRAAPVAWAAPAVLASNKQGAASTDLDPRGNQRRAAGPCTARVRCPARRPRPRPRPSRRGPRLRRAKPSSPAHQPSLHCQWHVLSLRVEYSGQSKGTASLTSTPILVHSAAHTPSDSASGAFALLAWIGSDAASGTAAQQRAAGAVLSGIVHRWHSVATQWMWLQHSVLR